LARAGDIGEIKHASVVFHTSLGWVFNDPVNKGWNEASGGMLGNGFGWGQLAHPLSWLFMVSSLTPTKVFSFNGKSSTTPADMYDSVSILCSNGATVSVSGVASIPGNDKIIDCRLVGTEGTLSYCGVDEDKGKRSEVSTGSVGQLELQRFDGRSEVLPGFEVGSTAVHVTLFLHQYMSPVT
jgi:predicted dehydrogenase